MVNLRLVHYIEKELDRSFQRSNIKQVLVKYGYKETEVDEAFKYLDDKKGDKHVELISSDRIIAKALPHKERHFGLILAGILLLIIGSFIIMKLSADTVEPAGPLLEFNDTKSIDYSEFNKDSTFEALAIECMKEYFNTNYDATCYAIAIGDKEECRDQECDWIYGIANAIQQNSKPACQVINDSEKRQFCHQLLDHDDSKCSFLASTDEQNACRATINSDESLCPDDECRQDIIMMDAIRQNDQNMCRTLTDKVNRNRCLAFITKDINDCANKEYCVDNAWFNVALLTKNATICNNVLEEQLKVDCANMVTQGNY